MGQSHSRGIKIRTPRSRIPKQELQMLKETFDRLQSNKVIDQNIFSQDLVPTQAPDFVMNQIFKMFCSKSEGFGDMCRYFMTFDDFLCCYVFFKYPKGDELALFCFNLTRMAASQSGIRHTGYTYKYVDGVSKQIYMSPNDLHREDLNYFSKQVISMSQDAKTLQQFFAVSNFDPTLPIKKTDFVAAFEAIKNTKLYSWVPDVMSGFKMENINLDEDDSTVDKRLTFISNERQLTEAQQSGLTQAESENIQDFFMTEIKGHDAKAVLNVIRKMFKDIRNEALRKYLIDAVSQVKGLNIAYLSNLALIICKPCPKKKKLEFLFETFSHKQAIMNKKDLKELCEIFQIKKATGAITTKNVVTLEEFMTELESMHLDLSQLEEARSMMIAMMALTPSNEDEEKQAILSALNHTKNVDLYIFDNLLEEKEFYVCERKFWDQWQLSLGFKDESLKFSTKVEAKDKIDNLSMMEPMHQYRLKDSVNFQDSFVLLPKFVYKPLSKWYACNIELKRQVIHYKCKQKERGNSSRRESVQIRNTSHFNMLQPALAASNIHFQQDIQRVFGDQMYELEIDPKVIYLAKVEDSGKLPYQKAFVNQKVDYNYLKKNYKSQEGLPFKELQLSRKTTLLDILQDIAKQENQSWKKGRLLIEDQIIVGIKLKQTLEDICLSQGQMIYYEFVSASNIFPSSKLAKKSSPSKKIGSQLVATKRTQGLNNLGNTCYMNSALQNIANIKHIHEYFGIEKRYKKQMNLKSKFGYQGQLVQSFGELVQTMWNKNGSVAPKDFKSTIGKCSEQFSGYDQQDSQEYLSFLLDGLHEELNLRQSKPYVENPDSKDRNYTELGLENWSNALKREWSFIFFLFYGQMQSELTCKQCEKKSVTFDLFSNVPLSLPEPSQITLDIVIYRVPNSIRDIFSGKFDSQLHVIDSHREFESDAADSVSMPMQRVQSSQSFRERRTTKILTDSINYMTNDQPIQISLKIDIEITVKELVEKINQIREVNIDSSGKTEVILYATTLGQVRGFFSPDTKLSKYDLSMLELRGIEIITEKGKQAIVDFYKKKGDILLEDDKHDGPFINVARQQYKIQKQAQLDQLENKTSQDNLPPVEKTEKEKARERYQQSQKQQQFHKYDAYIIYSRISFNGHVDNGFRIGYENLPDSIFIIGYHRRFVKKSQYFVNPYQPQLLGTPLIMKAPKQACGRRLYDEVWAAAHNLIKSDCIYHLAQNRWWERPDWEQQIKENKGIFKPFVLKMVERRGYNCCRCAWTEKCSGCIILPDDKQITNLVLTVHIAIEWHSQLIQDNYNQTANEVIYHASTEEKKLDQEASQINLEDCLNQFHSTEDLENEMHCSNCQGQQIHTKTLQVFRPPPVMIIQLKRFKFLNGMWKKLQTLIEFPIENLEMQTFVADPQFLKDSEIDTQYDLHGMINHYGTLGFGHYIGIVKNHQDQKWYKYDDQKRTEIPQEGIQKEAAYILFYIRKDILTKSYDQIQPKLNDMFPGKPIKTQDGDEGFIFQNMQDLKRRRSSNSLKVRVKDRQQLYEITQDKIMLDTDKDEFEYDEKDLQEAKQLRQRIIQERIEREKRYKMENMPEEQLCCSLISLPNLACCYCPCECACPSLCYKSKKTAIIMPKKPKTKKYGCLSAKKKTDDSDLDQSNERRPSAVKKDNPNQEDNLKDQKAAQQAAQKEEQKIIDQQNMTKQNNTTQNEKENADATGTQAEEKKENMNNETPTADVEVAQASSNSPKTKQENKNQQDDQDQQIESSMVSMNEDRPQITLPKDNVHQYKANVKDDTTADSVPNKPTDPNQK